MDFARGACLFGSLARMSGPCVAQILLRSLIMKYQVFRGVLIKCSMSPHLWVFLQSMDYQSCLLFCLIHKKGTPEGDKSKSLQCHFEEILPTLF